MTNKRGGDIIDLSNEREETKMKKYEVSIHAATVYVVEAENEDSALDKAFSYWEEYVPAYSIKEIPDIMDLSLQCPCCGATHTIRVSTKNFEEYKNGALARVAFPTLSPTEREQIISGLCPDCRKSIFGF